MFLFLCLFFCFYLALLAFETFFGHFFVGSQLAESEGEKLFDEVGVPLQIQSASIFPFSFPSYKSPDTKDDMVSFTKSYRTFIFNIAVKFVRKKVLDNRAKV